MGDAAGAAAAAAGGATAGAGAAAGAAAGTTVWHTGLDGELIGLAQNKAWDMTDPVKAFTAAATAAAAAQRLIGAPPEKVLRMPEASADASQLDAFWGKLGAVKEGKDIDLSSIKSADGKPFDEKLAEVIRSTAVRTRAPKDVVLSVAAELQKHFDAEAAAKRTIDAGTIAADKAALQASWGPNEAANMFVANQALEKLAAAANMPVDKAKAAWDALSKVGGIGAPAAMEMLRVIGVKMGEDKFVAGGGQGGGGLPMTREAAQAEITSLKGDPVFTKRYLEGGVEEGKRMAALHKIAHGQQAA